MIIPYFYGFGSYQKSPITWLIVFFNIFIFFWFFESNVKEEKKINNFYNDQVFMQTQGILYSKYILENKNQIYKSRDLQFILAENIESRPSFFLPLISKMSFNDSNFLNNIKKQNNIILGDKVAFNHWKKQSKKMQKNINEHPHHKWGLNSKSRWLNFISYQFIHQNFFHLISNLFFLLIFGFLLEKTLGSLYVIVIYLLSGIIGGIFFQHFAHNLNNSVIGASASISGLIMVGSILFANRNVKYIYFFFNTQNSSIINYLYLPAWIVLLFFIPINLSGLLNSIQEINNIAYSAHIGGILFGIISGIYLKIKYKEIPIANLFLE